jgi:uncharacterized membrane protein (UPF0127 family)
MRVLLLIAIAVAIYYAHSAYSANEALVFRRDTLTIVPTAPQKAEKEQGDEAESETEALPPRTPVQINAELRSDQALRLEWIYSLKGLTGNSGMMILFDPPIDKRLVPMNIYVPVDILFINKEGKIIQIAPEIVLSSLQENIVAPEPLRAWLFLQGGAAAQYRLTPGDTVNHPLFSPKPDLLQ